MPFPSFGSVLGSVAVVAFMGALGLGLDCRGGTVRCDSACRIVVIEMWFGGDRDGKSLPIPELVFRAVIWHFFSS